MTIQKVAVIGSGVMGSGIAAQIANAGIPVLLLDIVPADAKDRSMLAKAGIAKMLKTDPAPLMHPDNAALITPGNIEDDLASLKECDWVVEVVLEKIEVKNATYAKIIPHMKKGGILSSNTSTIPLHKLVEKLDAPDRKRFLITHFFNPPRYMRLLELVTGPDTDSAVIKTMADFCDIRLGKGVVRCNDTPGFIANRLGAFWLDHATNVAMDMGLSVEDADLIMSKPLGVPKTGVFGLLDLIGIDLMPHLSSSLLANLGSGDRYRSIHKDSSLISQMIAAGYTGRKGKGGFYRLNMQGGGKTKEILDLKTTQFNPDSDYKKAGKPAFESADAAKSGLRALVEHPDKGGQYAWSVLKELLTYAASLVPEIASSAADVDEAMRLGYNWKKGPFEMLDALGPAWFAQKIAAEGMTVPPMLQKVGEGTFYKVEGGRLHVFSPDGTYQPVERAHGVLLLRDIKLASKPVIRTASASVWDIGDGGLCVEFTGKMNALDDQVFDAYAQASRLIAGGAYKAMLIYNEGENFSVGANLGLALFAINIALWPQIDDLVTGGQNIYKALKYAPFPVVAAPSGMALGGGCEILLHADHIQAHAETYCGLVEPGVGLIPGWGGCKEMILRYQAAEREGAQKLWFSPPTTPMGGVRKAFETIAMAKVSKSAADAKDIGYFRKTDGITMNRDRLLADAKARAIELAKDYKAPEAPPAMRLPGPSGAMALKMAVADMRKSGKATEYDVIVSNALAAVLSGGEKADWTRAVTEDDLLALERSEFMALVKQGGTQRRIAHMLDTGKPLRN